MQLLVTVMGFHNPLQSPTLLAECGWEPLNYKETFGSLSLNKRHQFEFTFITK